MVISLDTNDLLINSFHPFSKRHCLLCCFCMKITSWATSWANFQRDFLFENIFKSVYNTLWYALLNDFALHAWMLLSLPLDWKEDVVTKVTRWRWRVAVTRSPEHRIASRHCLICCWYWSTVRSFPSAKWLPMPIFFCLNVLSFETKVNSSTFD